MNPPMQASYRGYPQTTHRSPAASRRPVQAHPGMMPMPLAQQQGAHPQQQTAPQRSHHAPNQAEIAQRQSRKPTDKNLPDGIEEAVIGDGAEQYKRLREVEKRLDATMMKKRLDIQDSVSRTVKRYRTMRIWISNSVENQPWQQQENSDQKDSAGAPSGGGRYRVKIEGRLLDDDDDDDMPTVSDKSQNENDQKERDPDAMEEDTAEKDEKKEEEKPSSRHDRKRLSHFFKSVTVDFDKPTNPGVADLATITWNKPTLPPNATTLPASADFDSLEFSRAAEVNLHATINLVRDENPERFRLSKELAAMLDVEEEARGGIVVGIWEYINAMQLQEHEEKRAVQCDDRLRAIFNRDKMFFPAIPEGATSHTTPLEPIKLPYTIRVDSEFHNDTNSPPQPTIYDIRVAVDDPLRAKMVALTNSPDFPAMLRQVSSLDDQLAVIVQALQHSKAKQDFFSTMGKDPVSFIKRWMNSQRRDLETILGEATRGGGEDGSGPEFRRGGEQGAWDTTVAKEAARYLLAKPGGR